MWVRSPAVEVLGESTYDEEASGHTRPLGEVQPEERQPDPCVRLKSTAGSIRPDGPVLPSPTDACHPDAEK